MTYKEVKKSYKYYDYVSKAAISEGENLLRGLITYDPSCISVPTNRIVSLAKALQEECFSVKSQFFMLIKRPNERMTGRMVEFSKEFAYQRKSLRTEWVAESNTLLRIENPAEYSLREALYNPFMDSTLTLCDLGILAHEIDIKYKTKRHILSNREFRLFRDIAAAIVGSLITYAITKLLGNNQ